MEENDAFWASRSYLDSLNSPVRLVGRQQQHLHERPVTDMIAFQLQNTADITSRHAWDHHPLTTAMQISIRCHQLLQEDAPLRQFDWGAFSQARKQAFTAMATAHTGHVQMLRQAKVASKQGLVVSRRSTAPPSRRAVDACIAAAGILPLETLKLMRSKLMLCPLPNPAYYESPDYLMARLLRAGARTTAVQDAFERVLCTFSATAGTHKETALDVGFLIAVLDGGIDLVARLAEALVAKTVHYTSTPIPSDGVPTSSPDTARRPQSKGGKLPGIFAQKAQLQLLGSTLTSSERLPPSPADGGVAVLERATTLPAMSHSTPPKIARLRLVGASPDHLASPGDRSPGRSLLHEDAGPMEAIATDSACTLSPAVLQLGTTCGALYTTPAPVSASSKPVWHREALAHISSTVASLEMALQHEVWSSGQNSYGELGTADTVQHCAFTNVVDAQGLAVQSVACGNEHTLLVSAFGTAYAVGYNDCGQCGVSKRARVERITPVSNISGSTPGTHRKVFATSAWAFNGSEHTFLLDEHHFLSMGFNSRGQCGIGTKLPVLEPSPVRFPFATTRVQMVSCSYYHSLFVLDNGAVFGCGRSDTGQLGIAAKDDVVEPVLVMPLHEPQYQAVVRARAGIALVKNGAANAISHEPLEIFDFIDLDELPPEILANSAEEAVAFRAASLEILEDLATRIAARTAAFGLNIQVKVVEESSPDVRVTSISAGQYHSVLTLSDGRVFSCGRNDYGQTGLQSTSCTRVFTRILRGALVESKPEWSSRDMTSKPECPVPSDTVTVPILEVSCGYYHTLLRSWDGRVISFGRNDTGMAGIGLTTPRVFIPRVVRFPMPEASSDSSILDNDVVLPQATQIAAGCYHSIVVLGTGRSQCVYSFGRNQYGQLGLGDLRERHVPCRVPLQRLGNREGPMIWNVKQISAGFYHSIILLGCVHEEKVGELVSPAPLRYPSMPSSAARSVSATAGTGAHSIATMLLKQIELQASRSAQLCAHDAMSGLYLSRLATPVDYVLPVRKTIVPAETPLSSSPAPKFRGHTISLFGGASGADFSEAPSPPLGKSPIRNSSKPSQRTLLSHASSTEGSPPVIQLSSVRKLGSPLKLPESPLRSESLSAVSIVGGVNQHQVSPAPRVLLPFISPSPRLQLNREDSAPIVDALMLEPIDDPNIRECLTVLATRDADYPGSFAGVSELFADVGVASRLAGLSHDAREAIAVAVIAACQLQSAEHSAGVAMQDIKTSAKSILSAQFGLKVQPEGASGHYSAGVAWALQILSGLAGSSDKHVSSTTLSHLSGIAEIRSEVLEVALAAAYADLQKPFMAATGTGGFLHMCMPALCTVDALLDLSASSDWWKLVEAVLLLDVTGCGTVHGVDMTAVHEYIIRDVSYRATKHDHACEVIGELAAIGKRTLPFAGRDRKLGTRLLLVDALTACLTLLDAPMPLHTTKLLHSVCGYFGEDRMAPSESSVSTQVCCCDCLPLAPCSVHAFAHKPAGELPSQEVNLLLTWFHAMRRGILNTMPTYLPSLLYPQSPETQHLLYSAQRTTTPSNFHLLTETAQKLAATNRHERRERDVAYKISAMQGTAAWEAAQVWASEHDSVTVASAAACMDAVEDALICCSLLLTQATGIVQHVGSAGTALRKHLVNARHQLADSGDQSFANMCRATWEVICWISTIAPTSSLRLPPRLSDVRRPKKLDAMSRWRRALTAVFAANRFSNAKVRRCLKALQHLVAHGRVSGLLYMCQRQIATPGALTLADLQRSAGAVDAFCVQLEDARAQLAVACDAMLEIRTSPSVKAVLAAPLIEGIAHVMNLDQEGMPSIESSHLQPPLPIFLRKINRVGASMESLMLKVITRGAGFEAPVSFLSTCLSAASSPVANAPSRAVWQSLMAAKSTPNMSLATKIFVVQALAQLLVSTSGERTTGLSLTGCARLRQIIMRNLGCESTIPAALDVPERPKSLGYQLQKFVTAADYIATVPDTKDSSFMFAAWIYMHPDESSGWRTIGACRSFQSSGLRYDMLLGASLRSRTLQVSMRAQIPGNLEAATFYAFAPECLQFDALTHVAVTFDIAPGFL
jgi:alpha-tubulin suppressor-like RCC1 family protein